MTTKSHLFFRNNNKAPSIPVIVICKQPMLPVYFRVRSLAQGLELSRNFLAFCLFISKQITYEKIKQVIMTQWHNLRTT